VKDKKCTVKERQDEYVYVLNFLDPIEEKNIWIMV
jgi:hypothetical protein